MTPHSSDDDDTYRTKEEREALKLMIVILSLKIIIRKEIINQEWLDNIEQEHKEIINKATKDAEKAPYPSVEETYQFVYDPEGVWAMSKMSYIEAIQQAQDLAMEHDNNVFILGEDVGRKGGVLVQLEVFKTNMVLKE